MMFDNVSWPSSMWGWIAQPPDPAVVGDAWKEMWKERIDKRRFLVQAMGPSHQARDEYWSATAVRDHYGDVGVPVFILSGWQDGYKNPVEHVIDRARRARQAGRRADRRLGPQISVQRLSRGRASTGSNYIVTHWWDRWLKGKTPPPETHGRSLPVWLGASKEPSKSACDDEIGKWVAEDGVWQIARQGEDPLSRAGNRARQEARRTRRYMSSGKPVLDTEMLETSSWGECGNDDLPGNQARVRQAVALFRQRSAARGSRRVRLSRSSRSRSAPTGRSPRSPSG